MFSIGQSIQVLASSAIGYCSENATIYCHILYFVVQQSLVFLKHLFLICPELEDYPLENLKALPLFPSNKRKLQVSAVFTVSHKGLLIKYRWSFLTHLIRLHAKNLFFQDQSCGLHSRDQIFFFLYTSSLQHFPDSYPKISYTELNHKCLPFLRFHCHSESEKAFEL